MQGAAEQLAIKTLFKQFVYAVKRFQPELLRDMLTADAEAEFSHIGAFKGVDEIIAGLRWTGDVELNVTKSEITNYVARSHDGHAQQCAYVLYLAGHDDGKFLHYFHYSGHYANSYVETEDGWKIAKIKYDLDWQWGNNYFVKDWTLIDYSRYAGHKPVILSELDAPWRVIPEADYAGTDEEQIADAFTLYAWGLDVADSMLALASCTDDVILRAVQRDLVGAKEFVIFLKSLSHKEAALQHACKVRNVKIDGDSATMEAWRVELNRMSGKGITRHNVDHAAFTAVYYCHLRKEDGAWKLCDFDYKPKVTYEGDPDKLKFVGDLNVADPESDSVIHY